MAEKNDQIASLDSRQRLPKFRNLADDAAEDAAVAEAGEQLAEPNPVEAQARVEDSEKANQVLEEMPIDVSTVVVVDRMKGNEDRRIIKLPDGTLGIHNFTDNKIYVEKHRKMNGVLDVYDFETGEKVGAVLAFKLDDKSAISYLRLKEMNDKLHPPAPPVPDILNIQNVETLRVLGGDRSVVKFPDGTLGVENSMRQSFLLAFQGEIYEFDSRTGKRTDEKLAISDLKGKTKEAFDLIAKMRGA